MSSNQAPHPILAIDYGEARIGLAATDEFGISVHPAGTVDARGDDPVSEILSAVIERGIRSVVLGLPLRMDGSEGTSAEKVKQFGKELNERLGEVPLHYFDERFTTVTASDKLRTSGKKAKDQKTIIDQAAAMEILNDYLGW